MHGISSTRRHVIPCRLGRSGGLGFFVALSGGSAAIVGLTLIILKTKVGEQSRRADALPRVAND